MHFGISDTAFLSFSLYLSNRYQRINILWFTLVPQIYSIRCSTGPLDHSFPKKNFIPKTKLTIAKRVFFVAAPTNWNQLPITIQSSETIDTFR